jgi:hypothetical protein
MGIISHFQIDLPQIHRLFNRQAPKEDAENNEQGILNHE